ncbi:interaptin-like isoform X2 [Schistocerca gregaria]|uniref:interaptin-like isoform X2 n=1 Tax=Schistocerca gregaria TaxID=7010 RepID=UPI00211DB1C8|nr:interaptin-like isoform X2 [Schistocerca gregaria]XP_049858277.1 interaptin-like isoform X2 [Schistocerca gregaria]
MSGNGSSNVSREEIEQRIRAMDGDCCKLKEMLLELEESLMWAEEWQHTVTEFSNDTMSFMDKAFHSLSEKHWNDLEQRSQQLTQKAGIAAEVAVNLRSSLCVARQILTDLRDEETTTEEYYWHQLEVLRQQSAGYLNLFKRTEKVLNHLKDVQTVYLEIQRRQRHKHPVDSEFNFQDVEMQLNNLQYRRDRLKRAAEELLKEIQSLEQEEQRVGRFIQLSNQYLIKLKEARDALHNENLVTMTHRNIQKTISKMEERMKIEVRPLCTRREILWRRHAWISYEAADCSSEHNRLAVLLQTHLEQTQCQIDTLKGAKPCIDDSCQHPVLEKRSSAGMRSLNGLQALEQKKNCKQSEILWNILKLIRQLAISPEPQMQQEIDNQLNELVTCEEFDKKEVYLINDQSNVDVQSEGDNLHNIVDKTRLQYLAAHLKDHISKYCATKRPVVSQMCEHTSESQGTEKEASLRKNIGALKTSCDDLRARLAAAKQIYQNLTAKLKKYQSAE